MKIQILIAVSCICWLFSCQSDGKQQRKAGTELFVPALVETRDSSSFIVPTYAKGYTVDYLPDGIRLIDIKDPQGQSSSTYHFALVPQGSAVGNIPKGYTPIQIPIQSAICMTSLQLSNFICLDAYDRVTGITSTRHLFNKEMNRRLKEGKTRKIGIEGNFDNEIIMAMNPDVIFISPFKRGGYEAMRETDIPLVPHLGYKETTPLGQAEWIKFIGLIWYCAKYNSAIT